VNVTGLPINGETIYARIYSFIGGAWHCDDYTYTAASQATLASPPPSSTLTGSSVTFTWSAGTGVTLYYLFLGSNGVGSENLYSSGYTTHNSVNVTGLPENGETVYARLYSQLGRAWHYLDYTYTAK
jgi:serine protease